CFSSRRRHTRSTRDWSSDVCSSDLSVLQKPHSFCTTSIARYQVTGDEWRGLGSYHVNRHFSLLHRHRRVDLRQHLWQTIFKIVRSEERRVGKECRCKRSSTQ